MQDHTTILTVDGLAYLYFEGAVLVNWKGNRREAPMNTLFFSESLVSEMI